jgi:tyrosine-protein kinase Etk/Wzc
MVLVRLSAIVCLVLARVYLATQNNVYSRQAVMLVKEDDNSSNGRRSGISTDALMQLNGVVAGSSVKNEVYILQSHQLVQEVVLRLHLDMFYSCKRGLRTVSLYKDKPFDVRFLSGFRAPVSMKIVPVDANTCRISEVSMGAVQYDYDKTINYNEPQHTAFGRFVVMPVTANLSDFKGVPIMVNRVSLETATNCYRGAVNTGEIDKESTLVKLTCTDTNMQRADDILSALLDAYKKSIIDDKNRIALSTEQFINSRIGAIHEELSRVEGNLASFKQRNRLIDFQQNATAYLTEGTKAKDQTTQLQSQLGVAENLMIFLKDAANGRELIPAISGVGDAALQNNIAKYNEMMLERNRLASNSSESSPVLREATQSLNSMRSTIIASMSGYISSLRVQLGHAQMVQNTMNSTISDVPGQEKVAQDITRQQGIKEALYTYLLNKREETELQLAITEANIRVIDQPFGSFAPIAPRRGMIQLAASSSASFSRLSSSVLKICSIWVFGVVRILSATPPYLYSVKCPIVIPVWVMKRLLLRKMPMIRWRKVSA